MKRIISITMCLCLILSTLTFTGISALADTDGYYTYTVTDGKATITDVNTSISGDITIPSELGGCPVTSIGNSAFDRCTKLISVTIPDSVTSIGSSAFSNCTSLTSITIPDSVTSIGNSAFYLCISLTSINVDENNKNYCDIEGVLINKNKAELIQYPIGNERTTYTIPDSVTSIGSSAFFDCISLTSIEIPDSVISIGRQAFYHCISLTSIEIPDSVTSIAENAFDHCTSLTSVTIGNGVTSIGSSAFFECTSLTSITIPDSVTSIGKSAFSYCTALTSITIPDSVTSIGGFAFFDCTLLTEIYILNKDCTIYDSSYTINSTATIYGYSGSTAESYATKYSRTFVAIRQVIIIDGQVVDYDNSDGEFVLPEIVDNIGALYFDGYNYFKPGDKVPSVHNGNFTTVTCTPQMQPGAAVRLNNYSGIRFYTKVDTNYIETLRSMPETTVELGTLIAPKDYLAEEELTHDLENGKFVDVKYTSKNYFSENTFVGSLVNIRPSNISRDFVGRGYMKVTVGDEVKIFYSDYYAGNIDSNSRSIALLAYALKNDSYVFDNLNEEYKCLIEYWASQYMY